MPRLKAIATLEKARAGEVQLSREQWYDLTLLETGDRDLAEAAHNAYCRALLRAGRTVD